MNVFAYGSLVNLATVTLSITTRPATVYGFVRQWRNCRTSGTYRVCALTLQPRAGKSIDGLLIRGGFALRTYLAERESQEKEILVRAICAGRPVDAQTFVARTRYRRWPTAQCPIWLSYVDCVLQGYLRQFGQQGLERFMATTEG